jgi:hypothetical protein
MLTSTLATSTLSAAVPEIMVLPLTVIPTDGDMILIVGGVWSRAADNETVKASPRTIKEAIDPRKGRSDEFIVQSPFLKVSMSILFSDTGLATDAPR